MREIKFRVWDTKMKSMEDDQVAKFWLSQGFTQHIYMQYTGLKDRNGVEIYEGDIVKGEYRTYVIEYYGAAFRLKTADDSSPDLLPVLENSSRIEVIGNIWENPELVEANQ